MPFFFSCIISDLKRCLHHYRAESDSRWLLWITVHAYDLSWLSTKLKIQALFLVEHSIEVQVEEKKVRHRRG
jgi:hypothetical protein